jgi:hypothetical protein
MKAHRKAASHPASCEANATGAGADRSPTFEWRLLEWHLRPETSAAHELALSTVTARRFCDQHEMSLQTATGRSLPYEIVRMRDPSMPREIR